MATIYGKIMFQNTVTVHGKPCYGVVKANNNKFKILIAKCAGESFEQFAETVLHELLHLWVFILVALTDTRISEAKQHKMIKKIMPVALRELEIHRGER